MVTESRHMSRIEWLGWMAILALWTWDIWHQRPNWQPIERAGAELAEGTKDAVRAWTT